MLVNFALRFQGYPPRGDLVLLGASVKPKRTREAITYPPTRRCLSRRAADWYTGEIESRRDRPFRSARARALSIARSLQLRGITLISRCITVNLVALASPLTSPPLAGRRGKKMRNDREDDLSGRLCIFVSVE